MEALAEALAKSQRALPFEAVYFPHVGSSSFVVDRESVNSSINDIDWTPGMKVRKRVMAKD